MTYILHASELDPDSNSLSHLTQSRYLIGRPSTAGPNPRGKHHRRPLPWDRKGLCAANGYDADAFEYRKWLWDISKEQNQQPAPSQSHREDDDYQGANRRRVRRQEAKADKRHPPKKANNKRQPNKKTLAPATGHLLALVDAHAKRNRYIYYKCGCCYDLSHIDSIRWWRRHWSSIREEGREDGLDMEVPLPGEYRTVREREWGFCGEGWDVGDEEERRDGEVEGMEGVERSGMEFVVRYVYGRRKSRGVGVIELDGDGEGDGYEEDVDVESWEWDFVGRREKHGLESMSDGTEWLAVSEDAGSWEGSHASDWETNN
ncbi:hypothetical protein B0T14DRAFT_563954 [Immersiella caudata]|uniref:Uncharacterized protein n=1 Tax=Immersiella caudata TaxID=314043 RepID=A0AA40C2F0_9PEZI|nr:hypothetical protein B0T14DRAFT_563954 [Immersiella caudata]